MVHLIWHEETNTWKGHTVTKSPSGFPSKYESVFPNCSLVKIPEGLPMSIAGLEDAGKSPNPTTGLPE